MLPGGNALKTYIAASTGMNLNWFICPRSSSCLRILDRGTSAVPTRLACKQCVFILKSAKGVSKKPVNHLINQQACVPVIYICVSEEPLNQTVCFITGKFYHWRWETLEFLLSDTVDSEWAFGKSTLILLVENEKVVNDLAEGIHGCPILRMEVHGLKRMAQIYVEDVRIYFHYFNNGKKNGRYARHMV